MSSQNMLYLSTLPNEFDKLIHVHHDQHKHVLLPEAIFTLEEILPSIES